MISKSEKFYNVDLGTRLDNVSVDLFKPAPVDNTPHHPPNALGKQVSPGLNAKATPFVPVITRSGRAVQPGKRLIEDN